MHDLWTQAAVSRTEGRAIQEVLTVHTHENVDYRGSTRTIRKTFCKDCQTVIDEMPQYLWKAKQDLAKGLMSAGSRVGSTVARSLEETTLSTDAAKEVIKCFVKTQNRILSLRVEITSTELISCLQDCIDDFSNHGEASVGHERATSSSNPRKGHGYPATLEEMNEIPEAELPLIDPRKDDDKVWILIDEGCNSICHGEHWRQEAEKIMPGCIKKIGNTGSSSMVLATRNAPECT